MRDDANSFITYSLLILPASTRLTGPASELIQQRVGK
jgi:hypothetical protein